MIAENFLKLLVCPETRTPLQEAEPPLVKKFNGAIARRELKNRGGRVLEVPLDGVLIREDQQVAYPIVDNIPMLLTDEGILVESVGK